MILVFNKKSIFICLLANILNIFNCKILITSSTKSIFLRLLEKLGFKVQCNILLYLEMSSQNLKDLGLINGDWSQVSNKCVKNFYQSIDILEKLDLFFPNIKDLQKKLKIFIYEYFDQLFLNQQPIIIWLKSSIYKKSLIINFSTLRPGAKLIWSFSDLKVIFILNYINFFLSCLSNLIINFIKNINKIFFLYLKKTKTYNDFSNKLSENNNFNENSVLFFPHCGVVTSGNPPKDHFYSDQIQSPFHPSKIIHLEYDTRPDIEFEKEKIKKYFKTDLIYYKRFSNNFFPWRDIINFIIKIFRTFKFSKYKNIGKNLLYYYIIFYAFVVFKRCLSSLEIYRGAKIALVGYEILFPKALALALESLNIKTIAISERFITGYHKIDTFMVNTLLSISESSSKIIKKSERFLAENIFPVGQVRSDHFFDVSHAKSKYKQRVVILDYHIENDFESEKFHQVINWKNDISFRNEILLLAENNPNVEFIFRGKNYNWYKNNKYHHDVVSKVDKLKNVKVDKDYSTNYWKSYHLCASADLVIARPTSLAEECVSKSINVIVMDYGINYKNQVSRFIPKLLRKYYCHSFEELKEKFEFWKKHKYVISNDLKNKIITEVFSNLTDGKVKHRIQKYLREIYISIK